MQGGINLIAKFNGNGSSDLGSFAMANEAKFQNIALSIYGADLILPLIEVVNAFPPSVFSKTPIIFIVIVAGGVAAIIACDQAVEGVIGIRDGFIDRLFTD